MWCVLCLVVAAAVNIVAVFVVLIVSRCCLVRIVRLYWYCRFVVVAVTLFLVYECCFSVDAAGSVAVARVAHGAGGGRVPKTHFRVEQACREVYQVRNQPLFVFAFTHWPHRQELS